MHIISYEIRFVGVNLLLFDSIQTLVVPKDRLTNLTQLRAQGRKKVTYLAVLRRQRWLDYLSEAQFQTQSLPTADPAALKRWLKTNKQISLTELDDVIQYHNMNRK